MDAAFSDPAKAVSVFWVLLERRQDAHSRGYVSDNQLLDQTPVRRYGFTIVRAVCEPPRRLPNGKELNELLDEIQDEGLDDDEDDLLGGERE